MRHRDLCLSVFFGGVGLILAIALFGRNAHAHAGGITGYSGNDGDKTCVSCHAGEEGAGTLTLSGPATVAPGATQKYTLTVSADQPRLRIAGFNVMATGGVLAGTSANIKSLSQELTHSRGLPMSKGLATFTFTWKAPDLAGEYTLFAAGIAANQNGGPGGDAPGGTTLGIQGSLSAP